MEGASADGSPASASAGPLTLWDWRRRVADLYRDVRAAAEPAAGWELWRRTRDSLFRDHPQSPLAGHDPALFAGLPLHAYDPGLRFAVQTTPVRGGAPISAEAGPDGALAFAPFALTRGLADRLGRELTLYWIAGYGGGVFLPFSDATSGRGTYGGGRYLLDTIKGADLGQAPDGRVVIDFNFAYNPSCAYSERWVCPLAPPDNRLPAAVAGGELTPRSPLPDARA